MRVAFIGLAVVALAGCVRTPPPAIEATTVTVEKIVPVPCVAAGDIAPEPPHVAKDLTGQAGHDLLVVDQSALQLRTWGEGMHAQLVACSAPIPVASPTPATMPPQTGPQSPPAAP